MVKKMKKLFKATLMMVALMIGFVGIMSTNEAMAQQGSECPDGSRIPAYYGAFVGPFTAMVQLGPNCWLRFSYCYRCDYPRIPCPPGIGFFDAYISSMEVIGNCQGIVTSVEIKVAAVMPMVLLPLMSNFMVMP